jgi:hypothetical protein
MVRAEFAAAAPAAFVQGDYAGLSMFTKAADAAYWDWLVLQSLPPTGTPPSKEGSIEYRWRVVADTQTNVSIRDQFQITSFRLADIKLLLQALP